MQVIYEVPISEEGQQRHREQKVGRTKFFREKNTILTQSGHEVNYVADPCLGFGLGNIVLGVSWHINLIYKPFSLTSLAPRESILSYDLV